MSIKTMSDTIAPARCRILQCPCDAIAGMNYCQTHQDAIRAREQVLPTPDFLVPMSEAADKFFDGLATIEYATTTKELESLFVTRCQRAEVSAP